MGACFGKSSGGDANPAAGRGAQESHGNNASMTKQEDGGARPASGKAPDTGGLPTPSNDLDATEKDANGNQSAQSKIKHWVTTFDNSELPSLGLTAPTAAIRNIEEKDSAPDYSGVEIMPTADGAKNERVWEGDPDDKPLEPPTDKDENAPAAEPPAAQ